MGEYERLTPPCVGVTERRVFPDTLELPPGYSEMSMRVWEYHDFHRIEIQNGVSQSSEGVCGSSRAWIRVIGVLQVDWSRKKTDPTIPDFRLGLAPFIFLIWNGEVYDLMRSPDMLVSASCKCNLRIRICRLDLEIEKVCYQDAQQ